MSYLFEIALKFAAVSKVHSARAMAHAAFKVADVAFPVSIRQHTSAYVSIRPHTQAAFKVADVAFPVSILEPT